MNDFLLWFNSRRQSLKILRAVYKKQLFFYVYIRRPNCTGSASLVSAGAFTATKR